MIKRLTICVLSLLMSFSLFCQYNFPFVDIHVHPDLKAFNSRDRIVYNLWEKIEHDCGADKLAMWMLNGSDEVPRFSQSNYASLMHGGFGVICHSMTPMEKGFFHPRFLNIKKKGPETVACMSGMELTTHIMKSKDDLEYWPELRENIQFIKQGERKPYPLTNDRTVSYEIVRNKDHFKELASDSDRLGVVLTIEGGHVLGRSLHRFDDSNTYAFQKQVMDNVWRLKGVAPMTPWKEDYLEYPIFFIGINHFFWNGLGGHSKAFNTAQTVVFGGSKGVDEPITQLGKEVIATLLSKEKGRRILLDAKHMSIQSRFWYYNYLDSLAANGDLVPLIYSHAGVAGISIEDETFLKKDKPSKNKDSYFNRYSVNLADEEIKRIHDTGGLFGIMLDKYRLCGEKGKEAIDGSAPNSQERKDIYIKILAMNILQTVKATNASTGWDIVCLGTDYDGMVQPFEFYTTAADLPQMASDLQGFLENPTDIFDVFTADEVNTLQFGIPAEELIQKLFSSNALTFIGEHFPENGEEIVEMRERE